MEAAVMDHQQLGSSSYIVAAAFIIFTCLDLRHAAHEEAAVIDQDHRQLCSGSCSVILTCLNLHHAVHKETAVKDHRQLCSGSCSAILSCLDLCHAVDE